MEERKKASAGDPFDERESNVTAAIAEAGGWILLGVGLLNCLVAVVMSDGTLFLCGLGISISGLGLALLSVIANRALDVLKVVKSIQRKQDGPH